ncbi:hypothetical protein [Desulfobacula sp.]|uniref:hypothetical protein n=1 Tax=Desulfobacula sp. TaxID=2593537 RepID=UPI0039B954B8
MTIMPLAHYGNIRADLEKKGTPIGVNDLHIAGHARSKSLILITNNMCEFVRVEGLRLKNWIETDDKSHDQSAVMKHITAIIADDKYG